jgi:hypothetical protein
LAQRPASVCSITMQTPTNQGDAEGGFAVPHQTHTTHLEISSSVPRRLCCLWAVAFVIGLPGHTSGSGCTALISPCAPGV